VLDCGAGGSAGSFRGAGCVAEGKRKRRGGEKGGEGREGRGGEGEKGRSVAFGCFFEVIITVSSIIDLSGARITDS